MKRLHTLTALGTAVLSALMLAACSSSDSTTADKSSQPVATPTATQAAALPAPAPAPVAQDTQLTWYRNNFFSMGIPDNWNVVSSDGPDIPAFVSVRAKDHSAEVTVRVSRSDLNVQQLCELAARGFVVNGGNIVQGPEVQYGTCIIRSDDAGIPTQLWLRAYPEDHSVYAINFTGEQDKVNEVLMHLTGDDRLMQLLVRPL